MPAVVFTNPTPKPPVKYPCPVVSPAVPPTENFVEGLVVPMPRLPFISRVNFVFASDISWVPKVGTPIAKPLPESIPKPHTKLPDRVSAI